MEIPKFDNEQIAQQFNDIVAAEKSLDNQAFLLLQKLKMQGVDVPHDVAQVAMLLHEFDPYPDNLGDRWTRQTGASTKNQTCDDFDTPWYQGRI